MDQCLNKYALFLLWVQEPFVPIFFFVSACFVQDYRQREQNVFFAILKMPSLLVWSIPLEFKLIHIFQTAS